MSQKTSDAVALVAGLVLLFAFFGLEASSNGFVVSFAGTLSTSSTGELNLWLGQVLLLCPGMLLIGFGSGAYFLPALRSLAVRLEAMSRAELYLRLATLTMLAFSIARVGRSVFLLDMPMSDDELTVEFGGRILASGHIFASFPLPPRTIPSLFLLLGEGGYTSFDWPGGLVISAAATLTKMGALLWTVIAVIPVAAVAVAVGVRLGAAWALAAALIFLCSPMATLMSMTTHAQLASRMFFGLALTAFSFAEKYDRPRQWLLTGVFIGCAFFCRPPETTFLAAPVVIWAAYRASLGSPGSRVAFGALLAGAIPGLLLLMLHSWAVTGNPLLPARFASPEHADIVTGSLWTRFGDNFSYNLLMLAIWFLGPVGLVLAAAGAMTDRFTRVASATVCSALLLTMFHDNSGLHIVGPIHYSECAVPLTLVAVFGARYFVSIAKQSFARLASALIFAIGLGMPVFTTIHGFALQQQAQVQKLVDAAIKEGVHQSGPNRSVILAPDLYTIVNAYPQLAAIGTWVHDWPRPKMDLSDDILYLRDVPEDIAELRRMLPDRKFYRLQPLPYSPYVVIIPLDQGKPFPLIGSTGP